MVVVSCNVISESVFPMPFGFSLEGHLGDEIPSVVKRYSLNPMYCELESEKLTINVFSNETGGVGSSVTTGGSGDWGTGVTAGEDVGLGVGVASGFLISLDLVATSGDFIEGLKEGRGPGLTATAPVGAGDGDELIGNVLV